MAIYDDYEDSYKYQTKLQRFIEFIKPSWWKYRWNEVMGYGSHTSKEFKSGNLAVVIATITLIIVLAYIIFHG